MKRSLLSHLGQRLFASHQQHRNDPPLLSSLAPSDNCVEVEVAAADASSHWGRLSRLGILPVEVQNAGESTRIAYAVPSHAQLS